mgnify:CR=1 FL=1
MRGLSREKQCEAVARRYGSRATSYQADGRAGFGALFYETRSVTESDADIMTRNPAMSKRALSRYAVLASLLAMLAALVLPFAAAQAREPISPEALVSLTGLDRALEEVATGLAAEGARIVGQGEDVGDPEQFRTAWEHAASESFSPTRLKEALARRIAGKLSPAELQKVESFYTGKLGKAMVAREVAASSSAAQQEMVTGAEKLMRGLASQPKRIVALDNLARAIRLKEVSTGIALNMMRAVMIGMSATNTSKLAMPLDVIEQQVEAHRQSAAAELEAVTALSMAFTYRNASVADLKAYEKFLRSPAGSHYNDVAMSGLDAVLSEGGLAFGQALARALGHTPI